MFITYAVLLLHNDTKCEVRLPFILTLWSTSMSIMRPYNVDFWLSDRKIKSSVAFATRNISTKLNFLRFSVSSNEPKQRTQEGAGWVADLRSSVAARGFLPPGANVCVAAPSSQIGNWYSYGYNDGIGVDCEQYANLPEKRPNFLIPLQMPPPAQCRPGRMPPFAPPFRRHCRSFN